MASQLRVNKSENRSGLGTITYTDTGAIVSGIVTANSFSGDIIGDITGAVTGTTGSFSGDVSIAEKIIHTGDTNTFMKFDTDTVTFETAGTERLRIKSDGEIGINTTGYAGGGDDPQLYVFGVGGGRQVKIHNPTAGTSSIQLSNATTGQGNDNGFQLAQLAGGDFYFEHQLQAKDIVFRTKPSGGSINERLRIKSDGKVLVGDGSSITPVKQFDVRGTGYQGILVGSTNNQGAQLIIDGIGGGDASGGNYSGFDVGTDGHLKIKNYDADKNIILGTGSQTGANDTLTIDSDQMVTIATRNSSSGGDHGFRFGSFGIRTQDTGGYNYWHIDRNYGGWQSNMISLKADGKVGIGIAAPEAKLHIAGTNDAIIRLESTDTGLGQDELVGAIEFEKNDASGAGAGIAGGIRCRSDDSYGARTYLAFSTRENSTGAAATDTEQFRILSQGGVTFNGDTAQANALDDYEEGNLTWYLRKSGSTSTGNDTGSVVKYTKVGRMVHISGRVRTDSTGSAANDYYYLDGTLPFTASTAGTSVVGHWRSQDQLDNSLTASIAWLPDSTTIYLYTIDSKADYNAASNNVPVSHQTNLVMTFSFTYQAT